MFTGIILDVGRVLDQQSRDRGRQVMVLAEKIQPVSPGDSIAVNGVCLTVAKLQSKFATFDVSAETLSKSTLAGLKVSSKVNIEQAMKPADRFGGHFVLGHTDGLAIISKIERQGQFTNIKFSARPELLEMMVLKGSIAVDGISLTIAQLSADGFGVAVIPQTAENTTLGSANIGDKVNIEIDIITKTVKRQLEGILPKKNELTVEKLKILGF